MFAINSILLPVDFSDVAQNAFRYAAEIARKTAAELHLLYCIPDTATDNSPFVIIPYAERLKEAKRHLDKFLHGEIQFAKEQNLVLPTTSKTVNGDSLKGGVEKLVKIKEVDLLIMGTKGRSNEWKKALGSKTSYLINQAPCPVLVVPADTKYATIERICIATDLNNEEPFNCEQAGQMFAPYDPELLFVHIITSNNKYENKGLTSNLHKAATTRQVERSVHFLEVEDTDVVSGLFRYARQNSCQLITMHRPEKSWLERTFKASNTREAILQADLPVLIISERL